MPDRIRLPRHVLALGAVLALLLVVVALLVVTRGPSDADRTVTREGTALRIGDEDFRFVGFNLHDAAASDIYSCAPENRLDDADLDAAMRSVREVGGTVVRFWAYQTYTAGGTDYSGVDRVIAAARAHDLRVMPVLEDGPGDCSTGTEGLPLAETAGDTWYTQGYREPLGSAAISYRDYVAAIARHYRDEPTIVAWSLVNEAETTARTDDDESALVGFARDVAAVVHAADPHHLVTLGTQGNGAPGASGADFAAVYGLPGLDLTEVHDWGYWGSDTEALPGADADGGLPARDECRRTDAQIACSFTIARDLDKPIVVGEAGIDATDDAGRTRRAGLFEDKLDAAFGAGASGYLVWQLNTTVTEGYDVLLGGDDPLYAVLRAAADRWATDR